MILPTDEKIQFVLLLLEKFFGLVKELECEHSLPHK